MARAALRARRTAVPIGLFSFLDILAGTVGVLILTIAVFLVQIKAGKQIIQLEAETSKQQARSVSYIICNGSGIVELHDRGESRQVRLQDPRVSALVQQIKADSADRYLIIGVRPAGFDDFEQVRKLAESAGIDIGYEPLDDGWRIRAPGGRLL